MSHNHSAPDHQMSNQFSHLEIFPQPRAKNSDKYKHVIALVGRNTNKLVRTLQNTGVKCGLDTLHILLVACLESVT